MDAISCEHLCRISGFALTDFSKWPTLQRCRRGHLKLLKMHAGQPLNAGVESVKPISFQRAKGARSDSEWFHSAGEKHFLN